jgi:hypothetical protein
VVISGCQKYFRSFGGGYGQNKSRTEEKKTTEPIVFVFYIKETLLATALPLFLSCLCGSERFRISKVTNNFLWALLTLLADKNQTLNKRTWSHNLE